MSRVPRIVIDITDDDDEEEQRHEEAAFAGDEVIVDGDDTVVIERSYVLPPAPVVPPRVEMPVQTPSATATATAAAAAAPQPIVSELEIVSQPTVEVVETQMRIDAPHAEVQLTANSSPTPHAITSITNVPAFHAARDDVLQANDAYNVRRLATHAQAIATSQQTTNGTPAGIAIDIGSPTTTLRQLTGELALLDKQPPLEALLLLERVSPLVSNRHTQYEQGDVFEFTDTFQFSSDIYDAGVGAYQHSFAFSGGRYEIAPPLAALRTLGLFSSRVLAPPHVRRSDDWRQYELGEALRDIGGGAMSRAGATRRGSGGLPTMFLEAALGDEQIDNSEFVQLYRHLEQHGSIRFSAEVLEETMDEVRARTATRATQSASRLQFAATDDQLEDEESDGESEDEEAAEEGGAEENDALPSLSEDDARTLEHIRALLSYESVLLERNDIWRSRVTDQRDTDGLYIVDDRVREYRLGAEDECYEYQYNSYVAMNDDEFETLEARLRPVPRGTNISTLRLPGPVYERMEIDETRRLGVKSVGVAVRRRAPHINNALRLQADRTTERSTMPVGTVMSEGKKRTYEARALEDRDRGRVGEEEEEEDVGEEEPDDAEELASDDDIATMERALEQEAFGDLNVDEKIARDAPARLDRRFTKTTIAVPLEWERSAALALVREAYQNGDPLDESTPWWKTDDAVWSAIVELALYEKLVPCFGPAFPEEARETLGIALELVLRRVNAENQFLAVNRSNAAQLQRQRATRAGAATRQFRSTEQPLEYDDEREDPPLDTQPVLLRVCVPNNSTAFGFLPYLEEDRETMAHIYALAGKRPIGGTEDRYAAGDLRVEADTCEPEHNYYPFASTYGTPEAIGALFNVADHTQTIRGTAVLRDYLETTSTSEQQLVQRLAPFRVVDPTLLGASLYRLYHDEAEEESRQIAAMSMKQRVGRQRNTLRATRVFVKAVYAQLDNAHNRVKPVFLAPPRLTRLSALRRAVQGPLFEEAFGAIGRFDAGAVARYAALNDEERALRAYMQLESRGAERLYANASQLYAQEHSSPYHRYVTDQAPRVRTNFRVQPEDIALPEGVYRAYEGQTTVDVEATLRLLRSRVSVGGCRIQVASIERSFLPPVVPYTQTAPFFYFCAPELTLLCFFETLRASNRVDTQVRNELSRFVDRYASQRLRTLDDYLQFRRHLRTLEEALLRFCEGVDAPADILTTYSQERFVSEVARGLAQRKVTLLRAASTQPDLLTTLPMSGMAALSRSNDYARNRLRSQLFEVYYRLASDLRFKRLGYLVAPFNSSKSLPLSIAMPYDNYQTLYLALDRTVQTLERQSEGAADDEGLSVAEQARRQYERIDTARRTGELELRTLRNALEREIETLHVGRTLWFETVMLCGDAEAFARQVVVELIALYTAIAAGRRVANNEPLEIRETDRGRAVLTLDRRAQPLADEAAAASLAGAAARTATDTEADIENAGDRLEPFRYFIDTVQDEADAGRPIGGLLRAPERQQQPAARAVDRLDLLEARLGAPRASPAPVVNRQTGEVETLRARLLAIARRGRNADRVPRDTEIDDDIEATINERNLANDEQVRRRELRQRLRMRGRAAKNLPPPLAQPETTNLPMPIREIERPQASHKRASIIGLQKAMQIANDRTQLTARQSAFVTQFDKQSDLIEFIAEAREYLGKLLGVQEDADDEEGDANNVDLSSFTRAPKKLRLFGKKTGAAIASMLERVTSDVIRARLELRRRALDTMRRERTATIDIDVQTNVVQALLLQVPVTSENDDEATRRAISIGGRRLSTFELAVSVYLLDIDLARIETRRRAEQLLASVPEREFRTRVGTFNSTVRISGVYVALLLPAATERARLTLQTRLELGMAPELAVPFRASKLPYAVAHRADAHQSLRVDELVRRYALYREIPLADNDADYAPYRQFERRGELVGRVMDEERQFAELVRRGTSEQHVSLNEGAHRQHAGGMDTVLSALIVRLLQLFVSIHAFTSVGVAYERSRQPEIASETANITRMSQPLDRLSALLKMFFAGRFPTLERMRPVDMRIFTLVLLGFDASSRVDNDLDDDAVPAYDSDEEEGNEDTPLTTPSYVHMRANAAKRCLADAYYRALLERMYHAPLSAEQRTEARQLGIQSPVRVLRVARDNRGEPTFVVELVERGSNKHSVEYQRGELVDIVSHRRTYKHALRDGKLRRDNAERIAVDRRLAQLPTVRAQIDSLTESNGDALQACEMALMRTLATRSQRKQQEQQRAVPKLIDQTWLLVPRISIIGALVQLGAERILIDVLEKILVTLDDSAHLLKADTEDDAQSLFAEQSAELAAIDQVNPTVIQEQSTTTSNTNANITLRNPILAAGDVDEWRAGVQDALASLLRASSAQLVGTLDRPPAGLRLLEYELNAVAPMALRTPAAFYASLSRSLVLARFIVEQAADAANAERLTMPSLFELNALFDSDDVTAARRTLTTQQFELTKLLVHAEIQRRYVWRPNFTGTALLGTRNVDDEYARDDAARFVVQLTRAIAEAYNGNKKRTAKSALNEYRVAHKDSVQGTINWRMHKIVHELLESSKSITYTVIERYLPVYDAIQLLLKNDFDTSLTSELARTDQLHPLVPLLLAPLTGRTTLLFDTAPFPAKSLVSCRVALNDIFVARHNEAYDIEAMRTSFARVTLGECELLHQFAYSVPAQPAVADATTSTGGQSATKKAKVIRLRGHNFITVNRVELAESAQQQMLGVVLGDDYSPTSASTTNRYRRDLLLIGMPILPLTSDT